MLKVAQEASYSIIEWFIRDLPGRSGRVLRRAYYHLRLGSMGPGVIIDCGVHIENPEWVHIGANSWIDHDVIILASPAERAGRAFSRKFEAQGIAEGEIRIGENCHIAPFVVLQGHGGLLIGANTGVASGAKIYSLSHHYRSALDSSDLTAYKFSPMVAAQLQSMISAPVVIGAGAAIGLNVVVLPGTIVGEGAWVGSGSVISGSVDADTVVSLPPPVFSRPIKRPALSNPVISVRNEV